MGSLRRPPLLQGFGIPHAASLDTSALDPARASFTESGTGPGLARAREGTARPRLVPRVHHAQDRTLEVEVTETGLPGEGLRVRVRPDGLPWLGWGSYPLRAVHSVEWSEPATSWALLNPAGTGYLLAVQSDGSDVHISRYDGSQWAELTTLEGVEPRCVSLVELPGGRILLGVVTGNKGTVYHSDDIGETWAVYASEVITLTPADIAVQAAMARQGTALVWLILDTDNELHQWASADLGASWVEVGKLGFVVGPVSAYGLPDDSGVGVMFRLQPDDLPRFARLISPWQTVASAWQRTFGPASYGLTSWADPSGWLYAADIWKPDGLGLIWSSSDNGQTWTANPNYWWTPHLAVYRPAGMVGCAYGGGAAVLGTLDGAGTELAHFQIGGWDSVIGPMGGKTWAGWVDPTLQGWSKVGTATHTMEPDGSLTVTTGGSSGAGYLQYAPAAGTDLRMQVTFSVPEAADAFRGIRIFRGLTGAEVRVVNIHASTTGYTVGSQGAIGTIATVAADMTQPMQLLIDLKAGRLRIWQRRPGIRTAWESVCDVALPTVSSATVNAIRCGNFAASEGQVKFSLLRVAEAGLADAVVGAPVTPQPMALPHAADSAMAYISAIGGPGVVGESYVIEPRASRGLANALVGVSPSPSEVWRSQDTSEQIIPWDLGDDEVVGAGYYLYLDKCNFRSAYLEGSVDGTTWTTLVEYDGGVGFTGLGWSKRGRQLRPTGATAGGRYIQGHELVGGHVLFGDGSTAKVTSNEGGHWSIKSTKQARLTLDSPPADATGTGMSLVWPGGVAFGYPSSEAAYRYIRVRIPEQPCPDEGFQAGVISWGRVEATGQVTSWGTSQRSSANYASTRNDHGTEYRRVKGPVGRTWSFGWQDGTGVKPLRSGPDSTDYIATQDGYPALGAYSDVWWSLVGLLEETEYVRPVLWCSRLPLTDGTVTDRSLYIFGWLSGDVQIDQSLGWEGSDEHGRISNLTIEELV